MTNTIIRASAGSGKTYQLSNRFLDVIFGGESVEESLDRVMASTFTCKAAGEITDRIFTKFADIVFNPKERERLAKEINYPLAENVEVELQNRLADLARNIYRVRVSTLHSYFNKIATVFALELGLPPGWSIISDPEFEPLLVEAVHDVFTEHSNAIELMSIVQHGRSSATIVTDLAKLAKESLPFVEETPPEAWKHDVSKILKNPSEGNLTADEIQSQLAAIESIDEDQLPKAKSRPYPPVQYFIDAQAKLIDTITKGQWDKFREIPLVGAIAPTLIDDHARCVVSRSKVDVRSEAPLLFDAIRTLLPYAIRLEVQSLIDQTQATWQLLHLVSQKLQVILHRERKFRFDDIRRHVEMFNFRDRLDSLNHRLDADTKHLLLDEFQDTSISQWNILEPMARKVVADPDGTFFCVGDVKQAIYSWRGGVATIFDTIQKQFKDLSAPIESKKMAQTRRNTQAVVDTVNTLFGNIASNEAVGHASMKAGQEWQGRFESHSTIHEQDEFPGYCTLEQVPDENQDRNNQAAPEQDGENEPAPGDALINYTVERIDNILKDKPSLKDGIGVLVFTNKTAEKIIAKLKERGIEANGRGRSLSSSLAVQHVLSALALADHPGNTIASFHLTNSPLAVKLGLLKKDTNEMPVKYYPASQASRDIRRELLTKGYGDVVKEYVELLAPSCDPGEFECLEKLLELAYRFDETASGVRTEKFVAMVKEASIATSNATNIQVMTVHGAKGLEFDIVVLPELNRPIDGYHIQTKLIRDHEISDDATTPINFFLSKPGKDIQGFLSDKCSGAIDRQVQGEVEESLSELYVAMTRAIHQLVMIVPNRSAKTIKTSFAETLRSGLKDKGVSNSVDATVLYEKGDNEWYKLIEEDVKETDKNTSKTKVLKCEVKDTEVLHHVSRVAPSSLHKDVPADVPAKQGQVKQLEAVAEPTIPTTQKWQHASEESAMLWGSCMHTCFEYAVQWLDPVSDGKPQLLCDDEELHEILDEIIREKKEINFKPCDIIAKFHENIAKPEIVGVLSQSRYPAPHVIVERERRFAVWHEGQIMRGFIDRLVIERNAANKVVGLDILDYKSDSGDTEALAVAYRDQLEAYRQGVATLFGVDKELIKATLVFVTLGKVVEL
ncbi:MAG: UvrD-helicase domain-containing protein [Planctomycetaceae bacterium]|nr:UvrD-helicase domain-containing protein [Planctomycetaceae bacterium]